MTDLVRMPLPPEIVEEDTLFYYRSLTVKELEEAVRQTLGNVESSVVRTTSEIRAHLVPALMVLRDKIPHGDWQKFLRSVNIKPVTFRQWRHRVRFATKEAEYLISGRPLLQRGKRDVPESVAQEFMKAGERLAQAVTSKDPYAEKLARDYLDAYAEAS